MRDLLEERAAARGVMSEQLILLDLRDKVLIVQSSVSSRWKCPGGGCCGGYFCEFNDHS